MSKQHDGYYYIHTLLKGTYRTKDFVHIESVSTRYGLTIEDCIVANNNSLIINGPVEELNYIPNQ
jgi:hypothetical protein